MRRFASAHKIFLRRRVRDFLRGKQYEVALDLGCGEMKFADIINARRYVGVDIDAERLAKGAEKHPHAEAIAASIEDIPPDLKGDLVLCLQCVGINDLFEEERGLEVVRKMIAATKSRGTLVFNVGRRCQAQYEEIYESVRDTFEHTHCIQYGRFWRRWPSAGARLLARLMQAYPSFARSPSRPINLYLCEGKKTVGSAAEDHGEAHTTRTPAEAGGASSAERREPVSLS